MTNEGIKDLKVAREVKLSALTFQVQFERFKTALLGSSGEEFRSFREGLPLEWEGYKEHVRTRARALLKFSQWKEKDIGTGRILDRVIDAIEINEGPILRNNLVAWQPRFGPKSVSHLVLQDARSDKIKRSQLERALYDLFRTNKSEGQIFEFLGSLGVSHYDLLSFLFFLKDWDRFMPISTTNFDKAFHDLGVDLRTTRHCSWDNYSRYNEALHQVLVALRDVTGLEDVRLIDAHSFCWMLVRLKPPAASPEPTIPLPKLLTSVQAAPQQESESPTLDVDDAGEVGDEDFDRRAKENRRRGRLAEDHVLRSECKRLLAANRADLAAKVKSVSNKPSLGYDILSWDNTGEPRHIEVKAARRSGKQFSFFLSENEWRHSRHRPNYYFYLVFEVDGNNPDIRLIAGQKVPSESRKATNYIVSLLTEDS